MPVSFQNRVFGKGRARYRTSSAASAAKPPAKIALYQLHITISPPRSGSADSVGDSKGHATRGEDGTATTVDVTAAVACAASRSTSGGFAAASGCQAHKTWLHSS